MDLGQLGWVVLLVHTQYETLDASQLALREVIEILITSSKRPDHCRVYQQSGTPGQMHRPDNRASRMTLRRYGWKFQECRKVIGLYDLTQNSCDTAATLASLPNPSCALLDVLLSEARNECLVTQIQLQAHLFRAPGSPSTQRKITGRTRDAPGIVAASS